MTASRPFQAGASAGKTWTLAALHDYLVLGKGEDESAFGRPLSPPEILLATFTELFTRELTEGIRQRLLQVGRSLCGEQEINRRDRFLHAVLQLYPAGPARRNASFRLTLFGESIDASWEPVIGAWCKRLLREHPLNSGSLFDRARLADESMLVIQIMLKHWRAHVHPMRAVLLEQVLGLWQDTEALRRQLARLLPPGLEAPMSPESLKDLISGLDRQLTPVLHTPEILEKLREWKRPKRPFPDQPIQWDGKPPDPDEVEKWLDQLPPAEPFEFDLPDPAEMRRVRHPIQHAFASGPIAGSFLHEQLEWLASRDFALERDPQLGELLLQRLQDSDYSERAAEVLDWLKQITTTPLPGPGVALAQLQTARAGMEFWLPLERVPVEVLDRICREHLLPGVERPALKPSMLQGMLTGLADLVFEHDGRYWVLDYRSNHLGQDDQAYGSEAIAQAMGRHRYDVEAGIQLGALHRLLASRLGDRYDPQQHIGGAVFLFLRGIHHPGRGTCVLQPGVEFLHRLDALLAHEEVRA
jgi:ATP-dependent exoDNAse (exonuclease V) beta subunit